MRSSRVRSRVGAELKRKGLTQSWLANRLGCSSREASMYARGLTEPRIARALEIAHSLGVSVEKLWELA